MVFNVIHIRYKFLLFTGFHLKTKMNTFHSEIYKHHALILIFIRIIKHIFSVIHFIFIDLLVHV